MRLLRKKQNNSVQFFDPSLTPYNATRKGYEYIDDIIYDFLNPSEALADILEFLREFHGKLGTPSEAHALEEYFGMYIPIQEKA